MARWESGNGVTIEAADDIVPRERPSRRGRLARGRFETEDVLTSVLADAGMLAAAVDLEPRRLGGRRRRHASAETTVRVDVGPNEDAVLLVEGEGGVFVWITAEEAGVAPLGRRRRRETRTFRIGGVEPGGNASQRGTITDWFLDKLIEPVRVYALRFVVGAALDVALGMIEGDFAEGLVSLVGRDPSAWVPGTPVPPANEGARILLFVHGTFSTTAGSFGPLTGHPEGATFLSEARRQYDAIIGFDHKSLGKSPEDNALEMMAALKAWGLPRDAHIDAVVYSRGALVYRVFAEELLAQSRNDVTLGKAVFVGCTNAGTHLAEPKNWKTLVDIATNLTMAGSRVILGMTGGAALAPLVTQGIKTIGRFVDLLPQLAVTENRIPGLAGMQPEGRTVKRLNGAAAGPEHLATYFAVSSNFEARFEPEKGLTRELAQLLLDGLTDGLFRVDNDLVVDTLSMTEFGKRKPRLEAGGQYEFGTGDTVYHTIYFAQPVLAGRLAAWLLESPMLSARAPTKKGSASKSPSGRRGLVPMSRRGPLDSFEADFAPPEPARTPRGPAKKALAKTAAKNAPATKSAAREAAAPEVSRICHLGAEMEPYPRLKSTVPLVVTVSADKLKIAEHAAAKTTPDGLAVDPMTGITWEIVAQRNCQVVGAPTLTIPVPGKGEASRETFFLNGVREGEARIVVEARQDMRRLVQFVLSPVFVQSGAKPLRVSESVAIGGAGQRTGEAALLRVYEIMRGDQVSLYFALECREPNISILKQVDLGSRAQLQGYVAELYRQVERMWAGSKPTYAQFVKALESSGMTLARQLLPEAIHDALWIHRDTIAAVQIISDEPLIPWELLYIRDRAGGAKGKGFLCEWGMVRWLHNAPWPERRLKFRPDRVRSVIPDYVDETMRLEGAGEEKRALKALFAGLKDAPAESVALLDFLETEAEGCDLLHFACHGEALEMGTTDAELQLAGRKDPDRIVPDSINGDQVRTHLRFGVGEDRPLVFINACQSGRPGTRLVQGVGGLVEAFIRPDSQRGAGAAVGTLWSIDDSLALTFATTFYRRLLAGDTLIDASQAARDAAKSNEEMTWLAYSVYGDPFAQVATGK